MSIATLTTSCSKKYRGWSEDINEVHVFDRPVVDLSLLLMAAKADPHRPQGETTPGAADDVKRVEAEGLRGGGFAARRGLERAGEERDPGGVTTLDEVCSVEANLRPSLIKVDVQGYEGRVLFGAATLLRRCLPAILLEFNPKQLALAGSQPEAVLSMLTERQYSLLLVDEELGALRVLAGPQILAVCLKERSNGGGFRNVVAAQPVHQRALERAGLVIRI